MPSTSLTVLAGGTGCGPAGPSAGRVPVRSRVCVAASRAGCRTIAAWGKSSSSSLRELAGGGVGWLDAHQDIPQGEDRSGFFSTKPGTRDVVVRMSEHDSGRGHFYVHVDAQPLTRNVDFSGSSPPAGPSFSISQVSQTDSPGFDVLSNRKPLAAAVSIVGSAAGRASTPGSSNCQINAATTNAMARTDLAADLEAWSSSRSRSASFPSPAPASSGPSSPTPCRR
jgi:hypothetical protein